MSTLELQIRDAGPIELDVEEEQIEFEDGADPRHEVQACLKEPFVTATTRFLCE